METLKKIRILLLGIIFCAASALLIAILMYIEAYGEIKELEIEIEAAELKTEVIAVPIKTEIEILEPEIEEGLNISEEEMEEMARIVMNEASIVSYEGKLGVAVTMVNRFKDGRWGETMTEVLSYPNAYSHIRNGEISEDCYKAVREAIECDGAFPADLLFFRGGHYHDFGYPYMAIDNLYFTTEIDYEAVK